MIKTQLLTLYLVVSVLLFGNSCVLLAEEQGVDEGNQNTASDSTLSDLESSGIESAEETLPQSLKNKWIEIYPVLEEGRDISAMSAALAELETLRATLGHTNLTDYSLFLIGKGLYALKQNDFETAAFYCRKALELSPESPQVLLKSLRLCALTRVAPYHRQLLRIFWVILGDPGALLVCIRILIYPILWACTIGLYITLAATFALEIKSILRRVVPIVPTTFPGIVAPLLAGFFILVPPCLGPLWCVLIWSVTLYLFLPEKKWLGFACGVLLALWGVLIPIRESVNLWLADRGVQALLRSSQGDQYSSGDSGLQALVRERPTDAFVQFTYALTLRKNGDLGKARQMLLNVEELWGHKPWLKAERGIISFLEGKYDEANALFEESQTAGLRGAPFYFNFSKIKFELMDTIGSAEYFERANKIDRALVDRLRKKEDILGVKSPYALADMGVPVTLAFYSALSFTSGTRALSDRMAANVLPGLNPVGMDILAGVLLLWFFLIREKKVLRPVSYFSHYATPKALRLFASLFPGGAWILNGKVLIGFGVISLLTFLIFPIMRWPFELGMALEAIPGITSIYSYLVLIFGLTVSFIGYILCEDI